MRTLTPALSAAAVVLSAGLALAGCGSSASSAASPAPTGPASTATATSAATTTSAAASPVADADSITGDRLCALVPVADADTAMGTKPSVTDQEPGTFVDGEPECGYASADQHIIINVTIFDPAKTKVDLTHAVVSDATLKPVPGLGKGAAYGSPELDVRFGDRALVVESFGPTDATKAQLIALAKLELSRLQ